MREASRPSRSRDRKLLRLALAIEGEDAASAGALGFMARELVKVGLPHREPADSSFVRRNGDLIFSIAAHPDVGLPYGRYPRLLLIWAITEAVRRKSPDLQLGPTLTGFMAQLGLIPAGGRWGTIRRLRDQMMRLFSSTIAYTYDRRARGEWHDTGFRVARHTHLWWNPVNPGQAVSWRSTVELSPGFYDSVVDRPVPIDLRAIGALRSPMALDIYTWLTYRMSYLRKPTRIPWEALRIQFGASYGRTRDFKKAFLREARTVLTLYPAARLEPHPQGVLLRPSPPHVAASGR